jgi:integrase
MTKALTHVAVRNAKPGAARREIHDPGCPGLFLIVQPSGSKSWAVRYKFRGVLSRKLTLGSWLDGEGETSGIDPELGAPLSLSAARELATRALRQVKSGIDPAAVKRQAREAERAADADTLQAIAEEYLRREGSGLRTLDQRKADLELLYKPLGALPIEQIRRGQFVREFDTIADGRGLIRADRVLTAYKRLLSWHSERSEYIPVLTPVKRRVSIKDGARDRVLTDDELKKIWTTAEEFPAPFGALIRFLLLTGTRRTEASAMKRSELTAPDSWVIPYARLKQGKKSKTDILLPLSKAAQQIISEQPDGEFVFGRGKPLGNFAQRKAEFDKAAGVVGWRLHDLRRTARTLLSRAGISVDVAERCLGHTMPGVRGTYDKWQYEAEMRAGFESLAALIAHIINPPDATVTDLAQERGKRRR